jgi:hypothetical protein
LKDDHRISHTEIGFVDVFSGCGCLQGDHPQPARGRISEPRHD